MAKDPKKASEQGKAGAAAEGEQSSNMALKDESAAKDEPQAHVVTRVVIHDGEVYVAGDGVALTRKQHAQLHAVGAVDQAWRD